MTDSVNYADMPTEIATSIVAVMGEIKPLTKDGENKFQKYNYVSVDQFYDLVGGLMSKHGIFIVPFEASVEVSSRSTTDDRGVTKESTWLFAVYDIFVYHKAGVKFGPVRRSIQVPAAGAQSFASAQSFVEKYFLRALFKIPTGEPDSDASAKEFLPAAAKVTYITEEQIKTIEKELAEYTSEQEEAFRNWLYGTIGASSIKQIKEVEYGFVKKKMDKRRAEKEKRADPSLEATSDTEKAK